MKIEQVENGVFVPEKTARLIARLLDLAADRFAHHGCNDFDATEAGLTLKQCNKLHKEMWKENGSSDPEDLRTGCMFDDWYLMRFFAERLEEET